MVHQPRVVQDIKIFKELGHLEATLIQANFRAEDTIGVADFHNHDRMSTTVQKESLVSGLLSTSLAGDTYAS